MRTMPVLGSGMAGAGVMPWCKNLQLGRSAELRCHAEVLPQRQGAWSHLSDVVPLYMILRRMASAS
jgi:hypothetical protein